MKKQGKQELINWITGILLVLLCLICCIQHSTNRDLRQRYAVSTSNEKSLLERLKGNNEIITVYQATIDNLRHSGDSTIQHLLDQQQALKIRNKDLQAMLSEASSFRVHDTLRIKDTLFRDPDFRMDTCLTDEWKKICMTMAWPNTVYVDATMHSQKDIFMTTTKETIEPPKRFFLCRWLQRKHTVARITIHEENPYLESQENVFIKVLGE